MVYTFADRMKHLGTEASFETLAKAKALERQGKNIIHLEIGDPDFDTPINIKEAAVRAIYDGNTHYVPAEGIYELREAIANYVSKTRMIDVKPEEVVVGPGCKQLLFLTMLALINPGEEVLYPSPAYPAYESLINFVGAKPVPIPLMEEYDFRMDHEHIKEKLTRKTKVVILNSPENPTGGILTKEDLKLIADCIAERDDVIVVSDEIYSRIVYEREHESIASLPGMKEKTIILDGFSKAYAMTGWRLGYAVMNEEIAQKLTQLVINSHACTCAFVQIAGIEALNGPQDSVKEMVEEFKKRREIIVSGLNKLKGFNCRKPAGTFYVFPNIKGTGFKSKELADYLLREADVAVLPGTAFGASGEGYLRLSFASSIENIEKALEKMAEALEKL
ncbi:MAG: pyridoxal phosphate-dependent aminotransferase [Candidatus Bathyarchaeota archaeon]|nr:pyridoxal phosphate-dependent aminotransferase [Candidatus Bathyarchaeota archaeon]MCX8177333.1 pyridoxal phosphate-dependent aminotransferase [Candidatus Bathyarchaeota archaeon]MDW8193779.1 pyridoxal phosphate-dependent aminotransferase [Nitrososphaerota archaeon]